MSILKQRQSQHAIKGRHCFSFRHIVKATAITVLAFSGLFTVSNITSKALPHSVTRVSASRIYTGTNRYWKKRIGTFANQRNMYRHPSINWNFRDIGGLETSNHKYQIKPFHVYRSGNLHYLNSNGAETLHNLKTRTDIDLRYPQGHGRSIRALPQPGELNYPDKFNLHMRYLDYPVQSLSSTKTKNDKRLYRRYGERYDYMRPYVLTPLARKSYHDTLYYLANHYHHNRSIMINCTQGRDRTGIFSIIFESALGVSKFNIYNDFLLTNYYHYQTSYRNQVGRINSFYQTIKAHYHSMSNYIHNGLDVSNRKLSQLQREYLEPVNSTLRDMNDELRKIYNGMYSMTLSSHAKNPRVVMDNEFSLIH